MDFPPALSPERLRLEGRLVILESLNPERHGDALWNGLSGEENDPLWQYLPDGPFPERAAFNAYLSRKANSSEAVCYAVVAKNSVAKDSVAKGSDVALGIASLMRIDRPNRVVEVGGIHYSRALQRTAAATEAMYLLARYAFDDLHYRRCEWKCNALNAPSRRAAERLGFTFEGVFRQHMIVKGKNRDTAWYSMLDSEWPDRKRNLEAWLRPDNFAEDGTQRRSLTEVKGAVRNAQRAVKGALELVSLPVPAGS